VWCFVFFLGAGAVPPAGVDGVLVLGGVVELPPPVVLVLDGLEAVPVVDWGTATDPPLSCLEVKLELVELLLLVVLRLLLVTVPPVPLPLSTFWVKVSPVGVPPVVGAWTSG
jgi:hypothetical protein